MTISVFFTIWISGITSMDLVENYMSAPLDFLKSRTEVSSVEFYTPEASKERVHDMDDLVPPALIVEISMDSQEAAEALVKSGQFQQFFNDKQRLDASAERIDVDVVEKIHFPLAGQDEVPARTAPMSFVVRYFGPVRDGSDFVDYYINHHPQIAAKFPGIRNVLCYMPIGWRDMDKVDDESFIVGNEVVFDDLESFKAALASEVFTELRADGENFEKWGYSFHHAMHRELVYSR